MHEGGDNIVGDQRVLVRMHPIQNVETDRALEIGRVKHDHFVGAVARNQRQRRSGQAAERIDDAD